jgi:hypothetical protein
MDDDDGAVLAAGCAGKLLALAANDDPAALGAAGQILALLAIADALQSLPWPAPDLPADDVPFEETARGFTWP